MDTFSIYRYMDLGIVHFKAFPQVVNGEGPVVETLKKDCRRRFLDGGGSRLDKRCKGSQ